MTSLKVSLAVLLALTSCCSALSVPAFCKSCDTNVRDPYCMYCCTIYSCCGKGRQMEQCTLIKCGCNPKPTSASTTVTTAMTTPATTTPKSRDCALPAASARILGGQEVEVCKRPWMVHFILDFGLPETIPSCSGVLISDTQILTSKTCVDKCVVPPQLKITLLAQFADSEKYLQAQREIKKDSFITHGDIAIVNFSPKVQVGKDYCILPVCLPDEKTVFTEDDKQKCKMASWGMPGDDATKMTEKLNEADVSLMSSDVCKQLIPVLKDVGVDIPAPQDGGICSRPKNAKSSTCGFDQGGMLMCQDQGETTVENWMLAGITYGTPCDIKKPSTFVNVTENLAFIKAHLAKTT